jgi:hypothetical protein
MELAAPGDRKFWVASDLNFPRPDLALLGCLRGQVNNKINDPAAIILRGTVWMPRTQSQFGFNQLKNKELLVPGRGIELSLRAI